MKMKIKKGDKVLVLAGKDKGKAGVVERVFTKTGEIIVAGANIVKKHVKVSKKYPSGGVVEIARPMLAGKVELICPNCGKATRVGYDIKGKDKARVCKKCGKAIVAEKGEKK